MEDHLSATFPIKTSIDGGFSIAMFDYQRVPIFSHGKWSSAVWTPSKWPISGVTQKIEEAKEEFFLAAANGINGAFQKWEYRKMGGSQWKMP